MSATMALDELEIRFKSHKWINDVPMLTNRKEHTLSSSVAIPGKENTDAELLLVGRSVVSLKFGTKGANPSWSEDAYPNMNLERSWFGLVRLGSKVYAIGGCSSMTSYEVLDLENVETGWNIHGLPSCIADSVFCKAVAVDNRYVFACFSFRDTKTIKFGVFDEQSHTWDMSLEQLRDQDREYGFSMSSILIPTEGSFVVVMGGATFSGDVAQRSVEAYHVNSGKWIRLPELPDGYTCSSASATIGNRYIVVAGGSKPDSEPGLTWNGRKRSRVIALDWNQRKWKMLPSLEQARSYATATLVPGTVNKLDMLGGLNWRPEISIELSHGLSWEKEKLLLLCFKRKSQKEGSTKECLLERLDAIANMLSYLFVPFAHEMKCSRSIFASINESPASNKRKFSDVSS